MKKVRMLIGYKMDDEIKVPLFKNVIIDTEFVKVYTCFLNILSELSDCDAALIMLLALKAEEYNVIRTDEYSRKKMLEVLAERNSIYTDQTIQQSLMNLRKKQLLIKSKSRGLCYVNPKYLFKGSEKERETVRKQIEKAIKL